MLHEVILTGRDNPAALAAAMTAEDIGELVSLLDSKADDLRYAAFLTLCARSETHADVYPYWDVLANKISDPNSYQRSIGLMLIARNVKWDTRRRFNDVAEAYLSHCQDEKFITSRQAIQSIPLWAPFANAQLVRTAQILMEIDIFALKETQRKLILLDILHALAAIRGITPSSDIDVFIQNALTGGILDKKSVKQVQALL